MVKGKAVTTMKKTHLVGMLIPADMKEPMELVAIPGTLMGMQQMVGNCRDDRQRYIEAVALGPGMVMYVDEDGLSAGWQTNARASLLSDGHHIVGDAVVLGTDKEGEDVSLLPEIAAAVLRKVCGE